MPHQSISELVFSTQIMDTKDKEILHLTLRMSVSVKFNGYSSMIETVLLLEKKVIVMILLCILLGPFLQ